MKIPTRTLLNSVFLLVSTTYSAMAFECDYDAPSATMRCPDGSAIEMKNNDGVHQLRVIEAMHLKLLSNNGSLWTYEIKNKGQTYQVSYVDGKFMLEVAAGIHREARSIFGSWYYQDKNPSGIEIWVALSGPMAVAAPVEECKGPYHVLTVDNRCVWSCNEEFTAPDRVTNECSCQEGTIEYATDSYGRRRCRQQERETASRNPVTLDSSSRIPVSVDDPLFEHQNNRPTPQLVTVPGPWGKQVSRRPYLKDGRYYVDVPRLISGFYSAELKWKDNKWQVMLMALTGHRYWAPVTKQDF